MNFAEKLIIDRPRQSTVKNRNFNEEMESDRGRILNSAALRRLQQKTQVFPLEKNAAVRSRLTHSLEVQQVGRFIAKTIIKKLKKLEEYNIGNMEDGFISAVEMSCLLHDIGNPPFGHFGESAINDWAEKNLEAIFSKYKYTENYEKYINDLKSFEGNAQAIRIIHTLDNLNLTFSQIACSLKYTRAAYETSPEKDDTFYERKKKPGYYLSEEDLINDIYKELNIDKGCRFPLTYIMEAADDIAYCILYSGYR